MAQDTLVEELLNEMHSFTEDAICPICEGHGAVSQGKRDIIIEMLPKPLPEGVTVSASYNPALTATVMQFTVNGAFVAKDSGLVREKWDEIEGELRQNFEKFLEQLNKGWQASNALQRIKKAEDEAQELKRKEEATRTKAAPLNQITIEETAQKMKEQEAALLKYMEEQHGTAPPSPSQQQVIQQMLKAQQDYNLYASPQMVKAYDDLMKVKPPAKEMAVAKAVAKMEGKPLKEVLKGIGMGIGIMGEP